MANDIEIVSVELDAKDGIVVTFPDGTIGTSVVEELLELKPRPELAHKVAKQYPHTIDVQDSIDGARGKRHLHVDPVC
jgi:hypothetical protein